MSRRKRANPVRVAAYVEEKQKLPHVDESAISHADVENCKPGHGTPVFIEPPRLEERVWADFYIFQLFMNERTITKYIQTLHHASRKNFTEPSRGSDTVLFTTSPPLRHSGTNLIKRYTRPLSFNRNFYSCLEYRFQNQSQSTKTTLPRADHHHQCWHRARSINLPSWPKTAFSWSRQFRLLQII